MQVARARRRQLEAGIDQRLGLIDAERLDWLPLLAAHAQAHLAAALVLDERPAHAGNALGRQGPPLAGAERHGHRGVVARVDAHHDDARVAQVLVKVVPRAWRGRVAGEYLVIE